MMCPQFTKFIECWTCCRKHRKLPERALVVLGWRKIDKKWECPLCVGNKKCMLRVLLRSDQTLDEDIADEFEEFLDALGYQRPQKMEG